MVKSEYAVIQAEKICYRTPTAPTMERAVPRTSAIVVTCKMGDLRWMR